MPSCDCVTLDGGQASSSRALALLNSSLGFFGSFWRSNGVRYPTEMIKDVHLDRDRSENLVLLPAIGENSLFDHVFDDQLRL